MRPAIGNHHAAEVIDNKLYLFGGLGAGKCPARIRNSSCNNLGQRYVEQQPRSIT